MIREYSIIAVDFDGVLCENKYPQIGKPNTAIIEKLKRRKNAGDKVILWTCRAEELLDSAVKWCRDLGLEFDSVNENLPEIIEQLGENPRKIYADEYIDGKTPVPSEDVEGPAKDDKLPDEPQKMPWEGAPVEIPSAQTPEDFFAMTDKQILGEVNKAILTILSGGQSYKIGSLELTRASLSKLYDMKKALEGAVAAGEGDGGIGRRNALGWFGRR